MSCCGPGTRFRRHAAPLRRRAPPPWTPRPRGPPAPVDPTTLQERALELFLQQLCTRAADVAQQRGARTVTPSHLWVAAALRACRGLPAVLAAMLAVLERPGRTRRRGLGKPPNTGSTW
jgi:hypothetical protein